MAMSGGMQEALRYNQQLQFCKQLQVAQQQLAADAFASDELLASLYALGKFCGTPACMLQQLAAAYPEFATKLQRSLQQHPLREMHIEQMEGDAVAAVVADAENLAALLGPMYRELQELGKFLVRASSLLADLHQLLIPVTMATAPQAIEFFMTLFCNTTRIVLLMDRVPWRLLVQVYTIVSTALDGSSPPGRTAVCELLERVADPVPYLQALLQPISPRVSQVLELAVSPLLGHVASAQVLAESCVLDITRLGETQLGITGTSLDKTYSFMQRVDDFHSWALLGFLACPGALAGVGAQPLMASLLREGFLLPVHGDVTLPLHATYQAHVTPVLEQLTASLVDAGGAKPARQAQLADARQLVSRCYQAAVEGAEVEHAARRRLIARVLQDAAAVLQDDVARLPDALPLALAAQAYAKSELLWYFRHAGEKLPPPPSAPAGGSKLAAPLLAGLQPAQRPQLGNDGQVAALVAATTGMFDLLEAHQDALQGHQLAVMRALLEQQVLPETAAVLAAADKDGREVPASGRERVVPKILVPLVKGIVQTLAVISGATDVANHLLHDGRQEQQQQPAAEPAAHEEAQEQQEQDAPEAEQQQQQQQLVATTDEPGASPTAQQAQAAGGSAAGGADVSAKPAGLLSEVQQMMVHLTMLLSSRNLWMRPAVLEAPAQDPQYLEVLHRLLERAPFALDFLAALDKSCCLAELVHHQHKLLALQRHVLAGTSLAAADTLPACPSLVKVLHWFEHNPLVVDGEGDVARDYASEAKALASVLLEEQCGTVARLLSERAQELGRGLHVAHADAAAGSGKAAAPRTPPRASTGGAAAAAAEGAAGASPRAARGDGDGARAPDQWLNGRLAPARIAAGGAARATVRSRAVALAAALSCVGPVRVSSDRLVLPAEHLRGALQQCLMQQLNDLVASTEVPPVPSQLVRTLTDLLWSAAELREVLSVDVTPELWQVLLNHAQPQWVLPPSEGSHAAAAASAAAAGGALVPWLPQAAVSSAGRDQLTGSSGGGGGSSSAAASGGGASSAGGAWPGSDAGGVPLPVLSMVQAYGDFCVQAIVRDARGLGVMYAPQLRLFTCLKGPVEAVQQRASLPELTALLQVFGPYAAVRLCEMTNAVLLDCMSQLDGCLGRWKELLDPITLAVVRDDCCLDAVVAASASLTDEGQVLAQARQLSRCLSFRQLLAEALTGALAATFPAVCATVDAVASNLGGPLAACDGGRHVCDLFHLPRPGLRGVGSPAAPDPVVIDTLVGSNTYDRYRAWANLPTLLGLVLQSPTITASSVDLAQHTLANELHGVVHAAKCLALAQQAAANRVLPCGSAFLHPEACDQAAAALACFAKVATTIMYSRNDAVGVRTCKQLLLEHLCPPGATLADAWTPATRIRSALAQAALQQQ